MNIPEALLSKKFAQHMESITVLYLADDEFKAICDDYCTSKMNLEKYKKKTDEDRQYKLDYETLSEELEDEILRFITNRK